MTIFIIGCGPTGEGWFNHPHDLSIGVNDCLKWGRNTDHLLVVNRRFSRDREEMILRSKPKKFFTTIPYFQKLFPGAEILRLQMYSKRVKKGQVYSSKTSPFIALSMAFNAGATNIVLFGCDLVSHPVIKDKLLDYELRNFQHICRELSLQGCHVWVSSKESSLSRFLPVWHPVSLGCYNFIYSLKEGPCEELTNHIKSLKLEPMTELCASNEYILQVQGEHSNPLYDIGEVEVIENDGNNLILKGINFNVSIDLTQPQTDCLRDLKVGDKCKAIATQE